MHIKNVYIYVWMNVWLYVCMYACMYVCISLVISKKIEKNSSHWCSRILLFCFSRFDVNPARKSPVLLFNEAPQWNPSVFFNQGLRQHEAIAGRFSYFPEFWDTTTLYFGLCESLSQIKLRYTGICWILS